jgi:hypothetical protein
MRSIYLAIPPALLIFGLPAFAQTSAQTLEAFDLAGTWWSVDCAKPWRIRFSPTFISPVAELKIKSVILVTEGKVKIVYDSVNEEDFREMH